MLTCALGVQAKNKFLFYRESDLSIACTTTFLLCGHNTETHRSITEHYCTAVAFWREQPSPLPTIGPYWH